MKRKKWKKRAEQLAVIVSALAAATFVLSIIQMCLLLTPENNYAWYSDDYYPLKITKTGTQFDIIFVNHFRSPE